MKKEEITDILFSPVPDVRIRVIEFGDSQTVIYSKKKYPFKIYNSITVCVATTKRVFTFCIHNGYTWNGADIPRVLWLLIGSRTDNDFLLASMVHDFLLDFRYKMMNEVLNQELSSEEYRRLTSLIFREILKHSGTKTIKANIMSWFVDLFQSYKKRWEEIKRIIKQFFKFNN